jgi:hypothetical protein|tara:strand:+ start:455 stop:604 length:150 start_codon:yes stop_codon:yes gene_type:complete
MLKQIYIYTAIVISLPLMMVFALISSSCTAIAYVARTWPEELYHMLNNE